MLGRISATVNGLLNHSIKLHSKSISLVLYIVIRKKKIIHACCLVNTNGTTVRLLFVTFGKYLFEFTNQCEFLHARLAVYNFIRISSTAHRWQWLQINQNMQFLAVCCLPLHQECMFTNACYFTHIR